MACSPGWNPLVDPDPQHDLREPGFAAIDPMRNMRWNTSAGPLAALLAVTAAATAQPAGGGWSLTWSDEFSGQSVDPTKWTPWDAPSPYNGELQYYSPDQASVQGGMLTITSLRRTIGGRQYSSARLESAGHFAQKYGRFEYRAKLPGTQSLWPAFWLLPATGAWPPEIDIMELLGHEPRKVYGTHHWGTASSVVSNGGAYTLAAGLPSFTDDFHLFAVEWWPDRIDWFVDGVKYYTHTTNIPQEPMYLIINTAVGGAWPGYPNATTVLPQTHVVDYVRVYQWQPANVLDNPAFEAAGSGATGSLFRGWTNFGNSFIQTIQPRSGLNCAKAFGNFTGVPNNASGFFQDVAIQPGLTVTASVHAMHRSADPMAPGNQARMNIEWYASSGAQLRVDSTLALPSGAPTDEYQVSQLVSIAPVGASRVRMALIHLQGSSGAGAVQFDDASLIIGSSCYANCDGGTVAPVLNINDFSCFINRYAAGDPYANCDASTVAPTLNVNDFSCFLNAFAAGCS